MGEGPFEAGEVAEELQLRPDVTSAGLLARHGVVEPAHPMPLADFHAALTGTRDQWVKDEA